MFSLSTVDTGELIQTTNRRFDRAGQPADRDRSQRPDHSGQALRLWSAAASGHQQHRQLAERRLCVPPREQRSFLGRQGRCLSHRQPTPRIHDLQFAQYRNAFRSGLFGRRQRACLWRRQQRHRFPRWRRKLRGEVHRYVHGMADGFGRLWPRSRSLSTRSALRVKRIRRLSRNASGRTVFRREQRWPLHRSVAFFDRSALHDGT